MKEFESWEGSVDDGVLDEVRELCRVLKSGIRRLGEDPSEDDVIALVAAFVNGLNELEAEHQFIGRAEAADLRSWFEEYAAERGFGVSGLDDLEDAQPEW